MSKVKSNSGNKEGNELIETSAPIGLQVPCVPCKAPDIYLREDGFGMYIPKKTRGQPIPIRQYTWYNRNRITVSVINYGATITKIMTPNRKGVPEDIVMGFDTFEGYLDMYNPGFGAIFGRVCNKIRKSQFSLDGKVINVSKNYEDRHFINGGECGFDKAIWSSRIEGSKVIMTHLSQDEDQGFPGAVLVTVTFELTADNKFIIDMQATSTKPTPINLTSNNYFNLGGHESGEGALKSHIALINADSYVIKDNIGFPTGQIRTVSSKIVDLQIPKCLSVVMPNIPGETFNHDYCLNRGIDQHLTFAARFFHKASGRVLEMYTNQPSVYFSTCGDLPTPEKMLMHKTPLPTTVCCGAQGSVPCSKMGFDCTGGTPCEPTGLDKTCCTIDQTPCAKHGYECNYGEPCEPCIMANARPCCEEGVYPCPKMGFECTNKGKPCGGTAYEYNLKTGPIKGKNNNYYHKHGAFVINSQNYPDAVNHHQFPNSIMKSGQIYQHTIVYKFWLMRNP